MAAGRPGWIRISKAGHYQEKQVRKALEEIHEAD
jgi:hypothetical protein